MADCKEVIYTILKNRLRKSGSYFSPIIKLVFIISNLYSKKHLVNEKNYEVLFYFEFRAYSSNKIFI
jgi:hypothetical protein